MDQNIDSTCTVKKCNICEKPGENLCTGCRSVYYCSKDHQKSDWKSHKSQCSLYELVENSTLGRHYIAKVSIPAGTKILSEEPLIIQPGLSDNFENFQKICLGCCSAEGAGNFCPKCKWPVCSEECSKVSYHAKYECKLFIEKSVKYTEAIGYVVSISIFIIRGILMRKLEPSKWTKIEKLVEKFVNGQWPIRTYQNENIKRFNDEILPYLKNLRVGEEFYDQNLLKSFAYLPEFRDFLSDPDSRKVIAECVYPKACLFSHDCFPNCTRGSEGGPLFRKDFWTTQNVEKGQILAIAYVELNSRIGAGYKRKLDAELDYFICNCARCSDPTEMGTMMSAVKCTNCPTGYFLPLSHSNLEPSAKWPCSNKNCNFVSNWKTIGDLNDKLNDKLENCIEIAQNFEKAFDYLKNLNSKFHPNHWLILRFSYIWIAVGFHFIYRDWIGQWDKLNFLISRLQFIVERENVIFKGLCYVKVDHKEKLIEALRIKLNWLNSNKNDRKKNKSKILEISKELTVLIEDILAIKKIHPRFKSKNDGEISKEILLLEEELKILK